MAKNKAFTPELTDDARVLAERLGIPTDIASKAQGAMMVSEFKDCLRRGLDYTPDYEDMQVARKLQDKRIQRAAELADHTEARDHADAMVLADLDYNAQLPEDTRVLLGVETADEKLERAAERDELAELRKQQVALREQVAKLKAQRAELSAEASKAADAAHTSDNGVGKDSEISGVLPS